MDPTRRLLRVFGVTVTNYEEQTAAILERARAFRDADELLELIADAIDQTEELNARLRDVTNHLLDKQGRVLAELRDTIRAGRSA